MPAINQQIIRALSKESVVFFYPKIVAIQVQGPDAQSFLQRISTNDHSKRSVGESFLNIFVNGKGRVVDLVHEKLVAEETFLLIPSQDREQILLDWLDQYHFGENLSFSLKNFVGCQIIGSAKMSTQNPSEIFISFDYVDDNLQKITSHLALSNSKEELEKLLPTNYLEVNADEHESLRIASLIPHAPEELCEKYNPLELGLESAVHLNKGCYVGQEVLARIDTYNKLSKVLTGVCNSSEKITLKLGDEITRNGLAVGAVTSVAPLFWSEKHFCALSVQRIPLPEGEET